MVRKKIIFLLLTLAMLVPCIALFFLQTATVHAATNQEQVNGIKDVNEELEFELTLPEDWKDHYIIKDKVTFVFKYRNKIYDNLTLFTIGLLQIGKQ